MNRPTLFLSPASARRLRTRGRTLVEMMVALGVFATATLGIWECIRTVFFLSAKNTGLNLSHTALQEGVDRMAEQLRESLQVVDVATFDGTTFTNVNEAAATTPTSSGNAVRFLRRLPISLYLMPDDGKSYSMPSPEPSRDYQNPDDYLTAGNKTVTARFSAAMSLTNPNVVLDLASARLLPRFPYITEAYTTGVPYNGQTSLVLPGMALSRTPVVTGTNMMTISLTTGLPPTAKYVPSCNQAYLVIVSAIAVLNRSADYAEMIYYPDVTNLTRKDSMTQAIASTGTTGGPLVFTLPKTAGSLNDPTARGSLQVTLPVNGPYLANTVVRRGGGAALSNISLTLPVETRRRAQF